MSTDLRERPGTFSLTTDDDFEWEALDPDMAPRARARGLLTQGVAFCFTARTEVYAIRRVEDAKVYMLRVVPTMCPGDTLVVTLELLVEHPGEFPW